MLLVARAPRSGVRPRLRTPRSFWRRCRSVEARSRSARRSTSRTILATTISRRSRPTGRRFSSRQSGATANRIPPTVRQRAATFIGTTSPTAAQPGDQHAGGRVFANGDSRSASHFCHPGRGRRHAEAVAVRHWWETNGRENEKEPELVLRDIKPVGYHAWANDSLLALFVLASRVSLQRSRWRIRGRVRLESSRPELAGRFSASRAAASASYCAPLRPRASRRF